MDTLGCPSYNSGMHETMLPSAYRPIGWRNLRRLRVGPCPMRWKYAFIHTYKPVLDDASYRAFDTMEDYRRWCEQNLPDWLGYARI